MGHSINETPDAHLRAITVLAVYYHVLGIITISVWAVSVVVLRNCLEKGSDEEKEKEEGDDEFLAFSVSLQSSHDKIICNFFDDCVHSVEDSTLMLIFDPFCFFSEGVVRIEP